MKEVSTAAGLLRPEQPLVAAILVRREVAAPEVVLAPGGEGCEGPVLDRDEKGAAAVALLLHGGAVMEHGRRNEAAMMTRAAPAPRQRRSACI